ncbi:MAG: hypothetical protein PHF56_25405 [Desulfuromonadaceae bacterium]|nr:hypothetical protein [Desulfuromonadaceae bacterium]
MPKKLSIEDVRMIVEPKGGIVLSDTYVDSGTKMLIRCKEGHEFEMDLEHIKRGQWCTKCSGFLTKAEIYQELEAIAKQHGGRVVSKEYRSGREKMEFECAKGHRFLSRPVHVRLSKSWCKICSYIMRSLTENEKSERFMELQKIAESRGGRLLSTEYLGAENKHHWQCAEGHKWWSKSDSVKNSGSWCEKCAGKAPFTIEELQVFASSKGGAFLSKQYVGGRKNHLWRCPEGHKWFATPSNMIKKNGSWCPVCQSGASERLCRQYFEVLFGTEFKKKRPKWLKTDTNSRLELDGYSEKLGIAFEYQGHQHFRSVLLRKNHTTDLDSQKDRDQLKRERCGNEGVTLIEVPYTETGNMEDFIRTECRRLNIDISRKEPVTNNELQPAYLKHSTAFKEFAKLVHEKNGKVLPGQAYTFVKTPIKVECGTCGHQWAINLGNLRLNKWCPVCGIKRRAEARRRKG